MTQKTSLLQEAQQDALLLEDLSQAGISGEQAMIALKSIRLSEQGGMPEYHSADSLFEALGI